MGAGYNLESLAAVLPPCGRTCLRIKTGEENRAEWWKARFLVMIKVMTVILLIVMADFSTALTIVELFSRNCTCCNPFGPSNNSRR